jgi:hypothetical protein
MPGRTPGARAGWPPRPEAMIGIASLLLLLLWLVGNSQNHMYAEDSLPAAVSAWQGVEVQIHHLAIHPLHGVIRLLGLAGENGLLPTIALFKLYVALLGVVGVASVGALAHRWTGSPAAALAAMACTAFSHGYWAYAIVTDIYVPAIALALLAIASADRATTSTHPVRWLLLAALAAFGAVMHHQVLAPVIVAIAGVLAAAGGSSRGERFTRAALFAVPVGLGLGFAYGAAWFIARPQDGLSTFLLGYGAWLDRLPYERLQPATPLYAAVGFARAVLFGDYLQALPRAREALSALFALKLTFDDWYLLADLPRGLLWALIPWSMIAGGSLVTVAARGVWHLVRADDTPVGAWMVVAWAAMQSMVTVLWEPTSNEFWIWALPCVALFAACAPWRVTSSRIPVAALVAFALLTANAPGISRYWDGDGCVYELNKRYLGKPGEVDLVLTADFHQLRYFRHLYPCDAPMLDFPVGAFVLEDEALQRQLQRVADEGGAVWLDPLLVMPADQELALLRHVTGTRPTAATRELLALERKCMEQGTPLFGVTRLGHDVVGFQRRPLGLHMEWLTPPSPD